MKQEPATFHDFIVANRATTCINLLPLLEKLGALSRLSPLMKVEKRLLETDTDIENVKPLYLVWYKPNEMGETGWDKPNSVHYTVGEYSQLIATSQVQQPDILNLRDSLSRELSSDVTILTAYDTSLNREVIVDGCKRAVALTLNCKSEITFSGGKYAIVLLRLVSKWAHIIYPCDFLPFLRS